MNKNRTVDSVRIRITFVHPPRKCATHGRGIKVARINRQETVNGGDQGQ